MAVHAEAEREFRWAALQAGFWLGWLSIGGLVAGTALGRGEQHRAQLFALIAAAALANAVVMTVPWRRWLAARRGQLVLDLWSSALIAFVTLLVFVAGARADFDLLLFLVLPFIASVQSGRRRGLWVALAGAAFAVSSALAPQPLGGAAIVLRAVLLAAAVVLTLVLGRAIARQAAARAEATARAELEHALLAEAHHRVKNSLQTVADLLLLGKPAGDAGAAFDETATRIRSIAAVHRLLADAGGASVGADRILETIANGSDPAVTVEAEPVALSAESAQRLGIVANELIANAIRHGQPPVHVQLEAGPPVRLRIDDRGRGCHHPETGLGLQLVRHVVEHGLHGRFSLGQRADGGTRAEIVFEPDAHPHR